jgi:hypothetical protein
MNSQRTLIAISLSLVLSGLAGCVKQPIAIYVNQNLTLNGYVEPGQLLEWRVSSPQSPPFKFKPDSGFCTNSDEQLATFGHPATCVVAPQHYPEGAQMNVYSYELQSAVASGPYRSNKATEPGGEGDPPATDDGDGPSSPPVGVFAQRVGGCGHCAAIPKLPTTIVSGPPQTPAGPPNPQVEMICNGRQLKVQANPQPASVGSSITWINTQDSLVGDWTIEFEKDGVCSPKPINAGHDNCTVQSNVSSGNYNYTAHLYKNADHSSGNLVCEGSASLTIQ